MNNNDNTKKTYFIQFDFWNERENKFWYGIVDIDLSTTSLNLFCRELIREKFNPREINADSVTIKINAFNRV